MKQIEVQIMGQGYLLSCPEGGERLMQQAVERVDAAMCKIRDAGKVKARDRIAVLASLNLAFELCETLAAAPTPAPSSGPEDRPRPGEAQAMDPLPPEDASRLQDLLRRLDHALDADGRLI
jgi:cell division protein ZapA